MIPPKSWTIENGQLTRVFVLDNFVKAVEFVDKIVPLAEEADHHPDLEIFAYKKVKVKLISHDAGEITDKDHKLAEKINQIR